MRKLTDKVVEAGIIPENALKLMRMWGIHENLPDYGQKREQTYGQLLKMVEEIGELLEEKSEIPEIKETDLDIERLFKEHAEMLPISVFIGDRYVDVYMMAAQDRVGRFIFNRTYTKRAGNIAVPGTRIKKDDVVYEIFEVETRYMADEPTFDVCTVKEVPNAKV